MSSLKLRKIAKIVKEMNTNPSQSRYDISGLTLSLCKFFYRTSQQLFQDLDQGDYTIDTSSNSQVLVIQNNELLKTMEAIQVCYILDTTSSKYETDFNVDINQLKDEYNHLVDDVHALWDYVKKVGIVADDTTIPLILPQLDTDEVWVKTEDGYRGLNISSLEENIRKFLKYLDTIKEKQIDELEEYGDMKKDEIQSVLDSVIEGAQSILPIKGDDGFVYNLGIDDDGFLFSRKTKSQDNPSELIIKKGKERYKLRIDVNGFLYTIKEDR